MLLPDVGSDNWRSLAFTAVAGLGGALGYIYREVRAGRKVKFLRVCLSAVLVAFVCFHLGLVYVELGFSERIIWALNGFTAVLGVEFAMNLVQKIVLKKLGITEDEFTNQNLIKSGWVPPGGPVGGAVVEPLPTPSTGK
jgi:hypothetical protein